MKSKKHLILLALGFLSTFSMWAQVPTVPKQPGKVNVSTANYNNNDIAETLRYVNSLFNLYNKYNSQLNVDILSNEIIFKDKFSEMRANFQDVEFRMDGENMGIFCKGGATCLDSKNVDTGVAESARKKYTFGVKKNDVAVPEASTAIRRLNDMLAGINTGSSSYNSSGLSAVARKNLKIINDAFDTYNAYETVFTVKGTNLHWDSSVANVYADLNKLTFYIDYTNKWMVMRCTDGDCMEGSISKDSYSMGLSTSSGIAPNIEKVLQAFNDLRREILTN